MNMTPSIPPTLNERDYEFMRKVQEAYEHGDGGQAGSIRAVAAAFQLSRVKVRKILITLGVLESDITQKALALRKQGKSLEEIAAALSCSMATVSTYLPYDTVLYNGEEKSSAAIRHELYRERNKIVADKQAQKIGRTLPLSHHAPQKKENSPEKEKKPMKDPKYKALKLRLSLDIEGADMEVLKKYGKVKDGITREVLVPAEMTLHALHFVIQRAFGWQNSHLHHFHLPDPIFQRLTGNRFPKWADYCGIYFRFPTEDLDDLYWDDDYDESVSPKTWMRWKYTGNYPYNGSSEHLVIARSELQKFIQSHPELRVSPSFLQLMKMTPAEREEYRLDPTLKKIEDMTCEEFDQIMMENGGADELLERLSLAEILGDAATSNALKQLVAEANQRFACYDESAPFIGWEAIDRLNGKALPLTRKLSYEYDYGDGWEISIELLDAYERVDSSEALGDSEDAPDQTAPEQAPVFVNQQGEVVQEELRNQLAGVIAKRAPLCTAVDGLPVLDDVGGICGYCDMLATIHPKASRRAEGGEDPQELKDWARMMGWTGRMNQPDKLL